jgi:serine/threonine protein kinase
MRSVGRYEILREIGRGGMGIVYLARQPDLDRLVALKELHSIYADTPEFAERFIRESRLAGSLNHPNIVTVYEYFEADKTPYIAMEHVPGGSLRSWVGELSLSQLAGVLEGLFAGLAAVAPSGIVHRDLKPENVMVTADGRVKIADFGIAKATQSAGATFMTATGTTVGTPAYMAPEQALSETIGPWTDLYSVGVMTYEQLVGRIPFHDTQAPMAILMRHVNEPIPPVIESRPDVDPLLSEWITRLLVKEPTGRTSSAVQAWEELEEIVLELLGPRWRRDARLPERGSTASTPKPLTPAPFDSRRVATPTGSPTPSVDGGEPPAEPHRKSAPSAPPGPAAQREVPSQSAASALPGAAAQPEAPSKPAPSAPLGDGAQPEAESRFLSYGRAPTAAGQSPPASERRSEDPPIPARRSLSLRRSRSARRTSLPRQTTATVDGRAPDSVEHTLHPRLSVNRRLGSATLAMALTAAVAGFVIVPAGQSTKAPVPHTLTAADIARNAQSQSWAEALSTVVSRLNLIRAVAGAQLAHAGTARTQAEAAERLAHAHEQAAAAVRKATPAPSERSANQAIATALISVGSGYSAMADAARRENRRDFDRGRDVVTKATASLRVALTQLHTLGYKLSG